MAKYVYKGKVNGNDVVYKEGCFHGAYDRFEGAIQQNIMEVITQNGKKFRFRAYNDIVFIRNLLAENKEYQLDFLNEAVIEEKGKKTLSYNARDINGKTVKGMRIKIIFEKANALYNEIRQEIMTEIKEQYLNEIKEQYPKKEPKSKHKELEKLVLSKEEEDQILEEVNGLFGVNMKIDLCLYRDNAKKFIELFSKIEDKGKKKELLNIIFNCEYENKEVIDWLNKNEQDLIREVGFNP